MNGAPGGVGTLDGTLGCRRTHVHPVVEFEFKANRYIVQILIPVKERLWRMSFGPFNMEYTGVTLVRRVNINESLVR